MIVLKIDMNYFIIFSFITIFGILRPCATDDLASARSRVRRIINGQSTLAQRFPWQVQIYDRRASLHGMGSIISTKWVLTAAQVVIGQVPTELALVVGSSFLYRQEVKSVEKVIIHEKYDKKLMMNDIAVVKSADDFPRNQYTNIVQMVDFGTELPTRTLAQAIGHGKTESEEISYILKSARMVTLDKNSCNAAIKKQNVELNGFVVTDSVLCATYPTDVDKTFCKSDAGDPLMTNDNKVVGFVIGVNGCTMPKIPGIFTNLSYFRNWVKGKTGV